MSPSRRIIGRSPAEMCRSDAPCFIIERKRVLIACSEPAGGGFASRSGEAGATGAACTRPIDPDGSSGTGAPARGRTMGTARSTSRSDDAEPRGRRGSRSAVVQIELDRVGSSAVHRSGARAARASAAGTGRRPSHVGRRRLRQLDAAERCPCAGAPPRFGAPGGVAPPTRGPPRRGCGSRSAARSGCRRTRRRRSLRAAAALPSPTSSPMSRRRCGGASFRLMRTWGCEPSTRR